MKKSVFALFFVIFSLFLCFGEVNFSQRNFFASADTQADIEQSNAFRIIRQADASGKIGLSYIFPVNSAVLIKEGFSEDDIKVYRFHLSTYVNALAGQNRKKAGEGVSVSNCTYFTDVDGLGFSLVFENLAAQKNFFGVTENETESKSHSKTSGFFIKKVSLSTTFPVSSTKTADDLKFVCKTAINSWCNSSSIGEEEKMKISSALDESLYIYDFASTSKELKSQVMYDDENFHHNVFIKSYADLENNEIVFFTTYPNTPVWYAFALTSVVFGMVTAYFVLKNRRKKQTF